MFQSNLVRWARTDHTWLCLAVCSAMMVPSQLPQAAPSALNVLWASSWPRIAPPVLTALRASLLMAPARSCVQLALRAPSVVQPPQHARHVVLVDSALTVSPALRAPPVASVRSLGQQLVRSALQAISPRSAQPHWAALCAQKALRLHQTGVAVPVAQQVDSATIPE